MADIEKVIKGLECCLHGPMQCEKCPYMAEVGKTVPNCVKTMRTDAIALLKVQEPKNILDVADSVEGIEVGKCPRCDRTIVSKQSDPTWYCKYCGQAVKWE